MRRFVVLDAMGVLYRHGNVVGSLLIPYLRAHGCIASELEIREAYRRCTLGAISTDQLWMDFGVAATASDADYCSNHEVTSGAREILEQLRSAGVTPLVLTNDAAPWSQLLRARFGLYAERWYVSSEIGARKPSPEAFRAVLAHAGLDAARTVLVDDRPTNLVAAHKAGFRPLLFASDDTASNRVEGFTPEVVHTMPGLLERLVGAGAQR
ncbi:HAD family hydrolase [Kribbella endophytica]